MLNDKALNKHSKPCMAKWYKTPTSCAVSLTLIPVGETGFIGKNITEADININNLFCF